MRPAPAAFLATLGPPKDHTARVGFARNALAADGLKSLQKTARERRNIFESLIEAVKYNSLGQISHALYEVGGEYRRNM